ITYICSKIVNNKGEDWLALVGCIGDHFLPDFSAEACKDFSELWNSVKTPAEAIYKTEMGKLARIFSFALKDKTRNVIQMLKFLYNAKNPYDILNSSEHMLERYEEINKKYQKLVEKAKSSINGNLLFFEYSGDLSISADISNELSYLYPNSLVVVCYIKGEKVNISVRGKKARDITLKAINGIESATGGGHENATGAQVPAHSLDIFKKKIEEMVDC
ncbi:MAG: DHH family phosphoesterase, partial [Nanoarchaeota archaeon]